MEPCFRAFTNGWVPWSVLIGPQSNVIFSENEFDESGFSGAIERMYQQPTAQKLAPRRAATRVGMTVVLGGGAGGLVAARELQARVPAGHRVVLVDRCAEHTYQPSLLWQMVGQRRPEQGSIAVRDHGELELILLLPNPAGLLGLKRPDAHHLEATAGETLV